MTPVALWTGRLPGLRPLPRPWVLWATAVLVAGSTAGAFGLLGPAGSWAGLGASVVGLIILWLHRWPSSPPRRPRPAEQPQGPDERAVLVEFRHEGDLLGWDVGVLWFERGGIGFVGRTVSFVVPRAILGTPLEPPLQTPLFRAPRLTVKLFETTVGIVPLAGELSAQTTLARIDALPGEIAPETILPPSSMHPDLLQRGLALRRRLPFLVLVHIASVGTPFLGSLFHLPSPSLPFALARSIFAIVVLVSSLVIVAPLPLSIRQRLPRDARRGPKLP